MAEGDEAAALVFPSVLLVKDSDGLFKLAKGGEEVVEVVGGGVPAEATDDELSLGGVNVGDGADGGEDGG